jgi:ribosomal-protein-alanine N-acetyltransferase
VTTVAPGGDGTLTLRQARPADLASIHRIETAAFPEPWPYSAFEQYLNEPGFLVAEQPLDTAPRPRSVVGYVVADTVPNHGGPMGHIKDLAVDENHRGQGVGGALLARGIDIVARTGAGSVKLEVRATNRVAIGLYRSFGFDHRRTIPNYYGNGEDALVMICTLDEERPAATD